MQDRLEILAFFQETVASMHKLARDNPNVVSSELRRIADELAREAAQLESDLLHEGLIARPAVNQN
jgi:hypothetical protein